MRNPLAILVLGLLGCGSSSHDVDAGSVVDAASDSHIADTSVMDARVDSGGSDATIDAPSGCSACGSGTFCQLSSCGADRGTCAPIPDACDERFSPVCGCDGRTYGNACLAAAAMVTVDHMGSCDEISRCGGLSAGGSPTCPPSMYCYYEPSEICGGADAQGTCMPRPEACPAAPPGQFCGCDGERYLSECAAAMAGTGVGPCR